MTLHLQMPISIADWMVTKCTSFINKRCCSHYGRCKAATFYNTTHFHNCWNKIADAIFPPLSRLLFHRSWIDELSKSDWTGLDTAWGSESEIPVVAVVSWELMEGKSISNTCRTSPSSSTNISLEAHDSPGKSQPASDDKLI